MAESFKDKVEDAGHKIAEKATEVGHKVGEKVEEATDWAKEKAHQVGDRIEETTQKVKHKVAVGHEQPRATRRRPRRSACASGRRSAGGSTPLSAASFPDRIVARSSSSVFPAKGRFPASASTNATQKLN